MVGHDGAVGVFPRPSAAVDHDYRRTRSRAMRWKVDVEEERRAPSVAVTDAELLLNLRGWGWHGRCHLSTGAAEVA
jgi:hypothetical protein